VLTRKVHQSIMIGDDVEIVVTAIKGEQVRLGITAPREIPVHRKEIYELIHGQRIELPQNGSLQGQPVS
jgi:carbon storage regulator